MRRDGIVHEARGCAEVGRPRIPRAPAMPGEIHSHVAESAKRRRQHVEDAQIQSPAVQRQERRTFPRHFDVQHG
jgi:hypothetical protein